MAWLCQSRKSHIVGINEVITPPTERLLSVDTSDKYPKSQNSVNEILQGLNISYLPLQQDFHLTPHMFDF